MPARFQTGHDGAGAASAHFTPGDSLVLQQLRLAEWAYQRSKPDDAPEPIANGTPDGESATAQWHLTRGYAAQSWQTSALEAWFEAGGSGIVKVITGAGKTVLALLIAEQLQRRDPELRIAIVVPTVVLMEQWYELLVAQSNLSPTMIARLGGGHTGDLSNGRRVLIAVLASAHKELPRVVRDSGKADHLLLIADECHRAGAPIMQAVLDTPRAYSLGLSATPQRDEDTEVELFGGRLGSIVYEMTFAEASALGLLPPFIVEHYGLSLNPEEAAKHHQLSTEIRDLRLRLVGAGAREPIMLWARRRAGRNDEVAGICRRFVNATAARKRLLYGAEARVSATMELVATELADRPEARIIMFHETIDAVVALFSMLRMAGLPAVMEHSELPTDLRETSLDLFRRGVAQVIVSAKSLIEGFNVPEADLGIIVASSSSPRQRIQSIGRVLRKGAEGSGKESRVCVLYISDSTDESIYAELDWDAFLGTGRNHYYTWSPPQPPAPATAPPRAPVAADCDVDISALRSGDPYPGRYSGDDYTLDSQGNILDADRRPAANPQKVPDLLRRIRDRGGRFRVSPRCRHILVRMPGENPDEWVTIFVGTLAQPFSFDPADGATDCPAQPPKTGEVYPGPTHPALTLEVKQRRGRRVLLKRVRDGAVYALGSDADMILSLIARHAPPTITRIQVNECLDVFWVADGQARYLTRLAAPLEFPLGEE